MVAWRDEPARGECVVPDDGSSAGDAWTAGTMDPDSSSRPASSADPPSLARAVLLLRCGVGVGQLVG